MRQNLAATSREHRERTVALTVCSQSAYLFSILINNLINKNLSHTFLYINQK